MATPGSSGSVSEVSGTTDGDNGSSNLLSTAVPWLQGNHELN